MLDTNTFSSIMSGRNQGVRSRFGKTAIRDICVSAVTRGEIEYGLAKRPEATRLARDAAALFEQIDAMPWTADTGVIYGKLRALLQRGGEYLGALDMLIAAHALSVGATLVTSDRAFRFVPDLRVEDWLEG